MFHVLEEYSPMLVPISIDEGFLDFTTMESVVWRNSSPEKYVREICDRIAHQVKFPFRQWAGFSRLADWRRMQPNPALLKSSLGEKKKFLRAARCTISLTSAKNC